MSFIDFRIGRRHNYVMTHAGFIPLLVMYHLFQIHYRKKEIHMSYVASVIAFSIFLDLLWKSTYLYFTRKIHKNPPQLNQFDVCAH